MRRLEPKPPIAKLPPKITELAVPQTQLYFLITCALTLSVLGGAAQAEEMDTLSLKKLVLKDDDGRTRALLTTNEQDKVLFLLADTKGNVQLEANVDQTGRPSVYLKDTNHKVRMTLFVDKTNNPTFSLTAPNGEPRLNASLHGEDPHLALFDQAGTQRAFLAVDGANGLLALFDNQQNKRVIASVGEDVRPALIMFGPKGEGRWVVTFDDDGTPIVQKKDADGNEAEP